MQRKWNDTALPALPWVDQLCKMAARTGLPTMSGTTVYAVSDYTSGTKSSTYEVIGLLLVDLDNSRLWPQQCRLVREKYLPDGRRMAYKNLNDAHRRQALVPFLEAANSLSGVCVTVAVRKTIKWLFSSSDTLPIWKAELGLLGSWNPRSFERMLRIAHFVAMMISGISRPGQNVYWITDDDDIVANDRMKADTARILGGLTSAYSTHHFGDMGIGTTSLEPDLWDEDLAAIADLAAGATAELLTSVAACSSGHVPSCVAVLRPPLRPKDCIISDWFRPRNRLLKHLGCVVDHLPGGFIRPGVWTLAGQ